MFLAFFALSLTLRAPITSLPPIIQDLKVLFHISEGVAGFLTSIPVLCFGVLTPLVGMLMKNLRLETSVFLTLIGITLGTVVRSAGGMGAAVAGTVLIGIALTAGNIAGLLVIGREFSNRISFMTGLYVCGMSCGSMGTMALTAPLSHVMGWQPALAMPALLAILAMVLWLAVWVCEKKRASLFLQVHGADAEEVQAPSVAGQENSSAAPSVLKRPLVWILSAAFAAHTFLFYGLTAWMPVYLVQTLQMSVATAGIAASLFQVLGLLGCFGLPFLASLNRFSARGMFLVVTVSWLLTVAGFWLAPSLWSIWLLFGGVGSGGGFTVIFSMIMQTAKNLDENRSMSTVVQTAGYIIAAISPFAVGYLHEVSGNWQGGMGLLTGAAAVMVVCGLAATRKAES